VGGQRAISLPGLRTRPQNPPLPYPLRVIKRKVKESERPGQKRPSNQGNIIQE